MMNLNGTLITTLEQLEIALSNLSMSDYEKDCIRNDFNGVANSNMKTTKEIDYDKYVKRAAAKDKIIAEMASENMERVRAGTWTVPDLIGLTQDATLKDVLDDISTLSFELAQMKLQAATNPLLTTEIKDSWLAKLQAHLYNS
jgi:hypothetical protein